jgi:uncharacterized protein YaaR (DUF327 family)
MNDIETGGLQVPEDKQPVSPEEVQTPEQSEEVGEGVIEDGAVVDQPETELVPEVVPEQEAELDQARKNVDEAYAGERDQISVVDEKKEDQESRPETPEDQEQQSENEEMDRLFKEIMEEMDEYISEDDREAVDKFSPLIKELLTEVFKSGWSKEKRENLQGKTWEQIIMEQIPGLAGILLVIAIKFLMSMVETTKKSNKEATAKSGSPKK